MCVYDRDGNESYPSPSIRFHCYGVPQFFLMYEGERLEKDKVGNEPRLTIRNSSATFNIYYSQTQNLALNSYRLDLYDAQKQLLTEGKPRFLGAYQGFGDLDYTAAPEVTVRGLQDDGRYFVQAVGESEYGMTIYSPMVELNVEYMSPPSFSVIEGTNIERDATIRIHSNLQITEGWCSIDPPRYIDNERIDLTMSGGYVRFDDFTLTGDFTVHIQAQNFIFYQNFLEIRNGEHLIQLKLMRGWYDETMRERAYIMCKVFNAVTNYEIYSNNFDVPYFDDTVYVWLRRQGNLYDLQGCVRSNGNHSTTAPRAFDVWLKSESEWAKIEFEGYKNVDKSRLEF